jgi:hypothetical protein
MSPPPCPETCSPPVVLFTTPRQNTTPGSLHPFSHTAPQTLALQDPETSQDTVTEDTGISGMYGTFQYTPQSSYQGQSGNDFYLLPRPSISMSNAYGMKRKLLHPGHDNYNKCTDCSASARCFKCTKRYCIAHMTRKCPDFQLRC